MSQKKKNTSRNRRLPGVLVIVAALVIAGGVYIYAAGVPAWATGLFGEQGPYADIAEDSQEIMANDEALRAYVKKYGPKKTTEHLYELSKTLGNCHNTAHRAGRFAYELHGNRAFKECSAECHSGCYHGATEAYFKEKGTADLAENLNIICSSDLNSFFSHQCLHGIGHGLMAWTSYELHEALASCDMLDRKQDSCYTGVFMENIVGGLESEAAKEDRDELSGHFTKYLNDDPLYPCTDPALADKYKQSCYFLQTSRMVQLFGGDFRKVAHACTTAPGEYHPWCFQSMGRDVGSWHQDDPVGAIAACANAPSGRNREDCIQGAVQDTFWDPNGRTAAVTFCRLVREPGEKEACYDTIADRARELLSDTAQKQEFCSAWEEQYRSVCIRTVRP